MKTLLLFITGGILLACGTMQAQDTWVQGKLRVGPNTPTDAVPDNSGANSQAIGYGSKSAGFASYALGYTAKVEGDAGSSITTATSKSGFALGYGAWVDHSDYAVAIGRAATVKGLYESGVYTAGTDSDYSVAIGYNTEIMNADQALVLGVASKASANYATVVGYASESKGQYATAVGPNVTAESYASLVLGQYNTLLNGSATPGSWVATEPLLVLGNGTATGSRSNALVVLKNGNTGIGIDTPAVKVHVKNGDTKLENGNLKVTKSSGLTGTSGMVLVPESGDLAMGTFTSGTKPTD